MAKLKWKGMPIGLYIREKIVEEKWSRLAGIDLIVLILGIIP